MFNLTGTGAARGLLLLQNPPAGMAGMWRNNQITELQEKLKSNKPSRDRRGGETQTSPQASAGGASVEESAELQHRKICFSSEEEMAPLLCVQQSPEVRGISSRVESWAAAHARASREAESLQRFPQTKAEEVWSRAAPACTRLAGAALVPTAPQQRRIQPSQRPFTHLLPRLLLLWF